MFYFPELLCFLECTKLLLYGGVAAVRVIGRSVNIIEGHDALLFCQLLDTAETLTSVTWQRRTHEQSKNKDFYVINSAGREQHLNGVENRIEFNGNFSLLTGSILLKNIKFSDGGIYTCIFNIFPSGPYETQISLNIMVPPTVSVGTEVIPVADDCKDVVLAVCTAAEAQPAAKVSWNLGALNDSVTVETNSSEDPKGTYTVKSYLIGVASRNLNQQKVQCLIKHDALIKPQVLDYTLNIHYPPHTVSVISVGVVGEDLNFDCVSDANPKAANVTWNRNKYWTHDRSGTSSLVIKRTPENNGHYYCMASNQYGSLTSSLYVDITPGSAEECKACWTLLGLILTVLVVVGVICYFMKDKLREKLGPFTKNPKKSHRTVEETESSAVLEHTVETSS